MDEKTMAGWLLEGDPAIRWQVLRDLADAPADAVAAERRRVAEEGWGAAILARQDPEGTWSQGLYTPKWTSTFYTLLLLRWLGLEGGDPRAAQGAAILFERGLGDDGGLNYSAKTALRRGVPAVRRGASEACVTGMGLAIGARFLDDAEMAAPLRRFILAEQMADGGWNCQRPRGATHSSFHTTISILEGLLEWERRTGALDADLEAARARAHDFLCVHAIYRSHTTGKVAHGSFTRFPFPPQWHYDALRGLDYLREAGVAPDERAAPAIELLRSRRLGDGRWPAYAPYRGRSWVEMEPAGPASRWNTLRALRVLRWWDSGERSDGG